MANIRTKSRHSRGASSNQRRGKTLNHALLTGTVFFVGHVDIRGGYYNDMWEAHADGFMNEGQWLRMVREPANVRDKNAIRVLTPDSKHVIGYVAKEKAELFAPFMDAGVQMALRVVTVQGMENNFKPQQATCRLYIKKVR